MSDTNRLSVPEIAAWSRREGVVSYAVRNPGARHWIGHACQDGACLVGPETSADPEIAARRARALLDVPAGTGDVIVDAFVLGMRMHP